MNSVIPYNASSYLISMANEAFQNGRSVFEFKIENWDGYEKIAYNYGKWSYEKSVLRR